MTLTEPRPGLYVLVPEREAGLRGDVQILADRCAGCQECVVRCPTGALSIDPGLWVAVADAASCVGCRQCERTCPFSAIVVSGPPAATARAAERTAHAGEPLGDLSEVHRGFASLEEMRAEAARCLSCPDPTCVRGCPAHNDIPGFIAAARDGDLALAHEVLRRTSVLPDVCSRVCDQASQCEGACSWALAGAEAVAIGRIERYIADHWAVPAPVVPPPAVRARSELSVAIVGSGPAGIAAAWSLVEAGASVTVYERDTQPGGLCNWGIPDFTLPAEIAARPWRQLVESGVALQLGTEVTPDDLARLTGEHDAVLLANGASQPIRLPVQGADLEGVTDATRFLKAGRAALAGEGGLAALRAALGSVVPAATASPKALVLGAGNTAMDVARTARRLGIDALCVDWLDEAYALARPDELAEARAEGVEVRFSRTLTRLDGDGTRVARAQLSRTRQERPDRPPTVLAEAPEVVDVDLVVMAMGYRVDPGFAPLLPGAPVRREWHGIAGRDWSASGLLEARAARPGRASIGQAALGREVGVEAATLPFRERVWVAGDALVGPSTVVEAMAQGRRAAAAILSARPRRPGAGGRASATAYAGPDPSAGAPAAATQPPRRVLVAYESRGGTTARAAELIGESFSAGGSSVRVLPISRVGPRDLVAAELVVLGTWVEGRVVARVRPAAAMRDWLAGLKHLGGLEIALFCTYAVSPMGALGELRQALEAAGADVLGQAAFARHVVRSHRGPIVTARFVYELGVAAPRPAASRRAG